MLKYRPSTEWTPHSAAYCNRDNTIIYRGCPQIGTLLEEMKKNVGLVEFLAAEPLKESVQVQPLFVMKSKSKFLNIQASLPYDCLSWFYYYLSIDTINISYQESYFASIDGISYME